jgi:arylsulfatase A-like enzyme
LPHANNEARQEGMEVPDLGAFADKPWPAPRKGHAAMITRMDRDIGRLMEKLRERGVDKNTVVLFTSDNGPHNEGGYQTVMNDSNGPLRGSKRDMYEGGIRVPMIAWWPGRIAADATTAHISGHVDLLPTLAALGTAERHIPQGLDGLSFAPTLLGKAAEQQPHDYLYWAFFERGSSQAVRAGKWKLVEQPFGTKPQLFDLSTDLSETKDVAAAHPDIVERLGGYLRSAYTPSDRWKFPVSAN